MLARLFREAAWAPVAVLVLVAIVLRTPYRNALDGVIHFLGGAAIAFFLHRAIGILGDRLGRTRTALHAALAFAAACSVAVLWEIAERVSDYLRGAEFRTSLAGSGGDLFYGGAGIVCGLSLVLILGRFSPSRAQP